MGQDVIREAKDPQQVDFVRLSARTVCGFR
jgi:hypothetical protein